MRANAPRAIQADGESCQRDLRDFELLGDTANHLERLGFDLAIEAKCHRSEARRLAVADAKPLRVCDQLRWLEMALRLVHPELDLVVFEVV